MFRDLGLCRQSLGPGAAHPDKFGRRCMFKFFASTVGFIQTPHLNESIMSRFQFSTQQNFQKADFGAVS